MDALTPLIENFQSDGRPRIWSLVITIFGDSVQPRGGVIQTTRLSAILGRMGIEQGALRTALSRLSSDGWVQSERHGRTSSYRLLGAARAEFLSATDRIYAPPSASKAKTWCVSTNPENAILDLGGLYLIANAPSQSDQEFCIRGTLEAISQDFILDKLDPAQIEATLKLIEDVKTLNSHLPKDPIDCLVARTLLVHRWRRLILRFPEFPSELSPWPNLRKDVAKAYLDLTPKADQWLDAPLGQYDAMPAPAPQYFLRFEDTAKT
jgi:phenylacetic acid degradation operon negative regulatory protein